jgi:DNA-binding transcriptional regulator YhcF (GntR family)
MSEQKGWIKIHKKIIDSAVWSDPLRLKAWIHILVSANYEDKDWFANGRLIRIQRGQFMTSHRKLSEAWGCSISTVNRILKQFVDLNMIEVEKPHNVGTLLTVVKYSDFQDVRNTKQYTDEYTDKYTDEYTDEYTDDRQLKKSRSIKNSTEDKELKETASPDVVLDGRGFIIEE